LIFHRNNTNTQHRKIEFSKPKHHLQSIKQINEFLICLMFYSAVFCLSLTERDKERRRAFLWKGDLGLMKRAEADDNWESVGGCFQDNRFEGSERKRF
jgi:hypothetical protein